MPSVGSWGNVLIFSTSDQKILTFNEFCRTVSGNWAKHSRIGLKDKSEFTGPGLQKVKFTIVLMSELGVAPRKMMDIIANAVETGEVNVLVIGGKRVGTGQWAITESSEAWDTFLSRGELTKAKVDITMEEYV